MSTFMAFLDEIVNQLYQNVQKNFEIKLDEHIYNIFSRTYNHFLANPQRSSSIIVDEQEQDLSFQQIQ